MTGLTNEQRAVSIVEKLLEERKPELGLIFRQIGELGASSLSRDEKVVQLFELHQRAVAIFNCAEQAVGSTELLGAHEKAEWHRGHVETCYNVLEHILVYYETVFMLAAEIGLERRELPTSTFAFGSLQRQVAQHLPAFAGPMRERFEALALPAHGFNEAAVGTTAARTKITSEITENGARLQVEGLESEHARDFLRDHKAVRTKRGIATGPFETAEMQKIVESLAELPISEEKP